MQRTSWFCMACCLILGIDGPVLRADDAASTSLTGISTLKVGEPAPALYGIDASGENWLFLRDFDSLGRTTVVLEFWSMKDKDRDIADERLFKLTKEFSGYKQFLILSLCIETTDMEGEIFDQFRDYCTVQDKKLDEFCKSHDYQHRGFNPLRYLSTPSEQFKGVELLNESYEITKTPCYFLLGPQKRLVAAKIHPLKLRSAIADHLKASSEK